MSSKQQEASELPGEVPPLQQQQRDSNTSSAANTKRRRELFGDCALVEIIHLHDCLRGALNALEKDVNELSQTVLDGAFRNNVELLMDLERRVAGRFKVIWSVFRAHSSAEDEFIWPALQSKTKGRVKGSPSYTPDQHHHHHQHQHSHHHQHNHHQQTGQTETEEEPHTPPRGGNNTEVIEQEEYEEDHADEERMFSMMDDLLTKLREGLTEQKRQETAAPTAQNSAEEEKETPLQDDHNHDDDDDDDVDDTMKDIHKLTKKLSQHLMAHLEKEEQQCMPLVVKHLSKSEIHDLVGKIMGKRSSSMIAQIMTMAVQNLETADREEMVKYMKQAMAGTFFDRWLSMSGWMSDKKKTTPDDDDDDESTKKRLAEASSNPSLASGGGNKKMKIERNDMSSTYSTSAAVAASSSATATSTIISNAAASAANPAGQITSQAELEKLIRAIATNPNLTPLQKNTTIQGLRDSVWKSNQLHKDNSTQSFASSSAAATGITARRVTPPAIYYKKKDGKLDVVWSSDGPASRVAADGSVPLFSASELAPSYHDGATGAVLGCPHYARACKLRHPLSGRLYTCRLCCEQEREMPSKDQDEPLDRYAVTEVMCMKCNALQPAEDRCLNPNCESHGKAFAKYFCRICHLYDDRPRPIFHCPYCNCCRMGLGLGIDFRHCMRCNACVSLSDDDHRCIPQKLQGSCPICHESLFQSTKPLRGLKCGHVMHLSCFNDYRRGQSHTCPLCMRSMEDMSDYFALLDAAVRMQPMPTAYLNTLSNVYCQDCEKTGQCKYHFVGQKCPHCGSYNTREMGRVQATDTK